MMACPGRGSTERSVGVRCRPGTVSNTGLGTVPDRRCSVSLRFTLHRVRDALSGRAFYFSGSRIAQPTCRLSPARRNGSTKPGWISAPAAIVR